MSGANWEIAHLALDPAKVAAVAAGDDTFLKNLVEHPMMKGPSLRRGNSALSKHFAADYAHSMEKRELVRIFIGFEGCFVHQAADGEVSQQESVEFLAHQIGVLLRSTIRAPRRWVLSSSNAVSISPRW